MDVNLQTVTRELTRRYPEYFATTDAFIDNESIPVQAKGMYIGNIIRRHYEGFDARIYDLADELISIGDYVLTGGELPAMVIVDAVARMLPNVLGSAESAVTDSFFDGMLGYPQYTRPREFEGRVVPDVLLSGNHAEIKKWREAQALNLTRTRRPDLIR